jgi:mono/diheme cytochrome c family protein
VCKKFVWGISIFLFLALSGCTASTKSIVGVVHSPSGPVEGAVVRVQTTGTFTTTDGTGAFALTGLDPGDAVFVTAWAQGYYIAGVEAAPGAEGVEIELHPHHAGDNPDYAWLPSQYHPGQGEDQGCAECHSSADIGSTTALPVDEWLLDAHSSSAANPRFLTMYTGTDLSGNQSPPTRFASSRDYGSFPLPPDPIQPYYGPGYKLDFPETAGNCAACHTPAASVNNPYSVDPTTVSGVAAEGVPCDFCHKVWDVRLDPVSGMPYPNMPGVLSYAFLRPPEGHQFFAGPYDDVAPGEDTYSPLQRESQFCAPCHFGVFWETVVYNSFGEWLESQYSDPASGQTCQDCHMPPGLSDHFALPEAGGLVRDPQTIFSHRMPGAADEELLQNAVTMTVDARQENGEIAVQVGIFNDNTGHHIPTDSPLRHLILVVTAVDQDGSPLEQLDGPVIPDWGGIGDPAQGYYAGQPGTIYAKVLEELWTEVSPTGAYWNPTRVVSDNRIPAMETASSSYLFAAPEEGDAALEVRLSFRRAFIELVEQKGWDAPDILVAAETLVLE